MDLSNPTPRWREYREESPPAHSFLSGLAEAGFEAGEPPVPSSTVEDEV